MVDVHTILADHRSNRKGDYDSPEPIIHSKVPTTSDIPDLFFDSILPVYKLTRIEIMVLMYIYRKVWCRPNLYKVYGISPIMSHTEMAKCLSIELEDVYHALRKIEEYQFISTIRSGQYFVRKYFTRENDELYEQNYDDFEE